MVSSAHVDPEPDAARIRVVIPVKAFHRAKVRLSGVLDPQLRAALARSMADHVLAVSAPFPVTIVCEDDEVATWAASRGAEVEWTPDLGLNGAVQEAVERLRVRGIERVVVAHADLPFARDLAALGRADPDEVLLVPDRRGTGTNVLSVPTVTRFVFSYGVDSFERHLAETTRRGLRARVVESEFLGWDVDEPDDLAVPTRLGDDSPLVTDGLLGSTS